jgi:hypothetical protein
LFLGMILGPPQSFSHMQKLHKQTWKGKHNEERSNKHHMHIKIIVNKMSTKWMLNLL